jgi:hypothetical protein
VALSWTKPKHVRGVHRYRVYRDGRPLATTRRRSYRDAGLPAGSLHRYSVAALRRGRVVRRSRVVRVRAGASAVFAASSGTRRHLVKAWLVPAKSRLWRRAYVERLVTVRGHRVWRRVSRALRARRSTALAVPGGRVPMLVRVVVRSARRRHGAILRSRAFRLAPPAPAPAPAPPAG